VIQVVAISSPPIFQSMLIGLPGVTHALPTFLTVARNSTSFSMKTGSWLNEMPPSSLQLIAVMVRSARLWGRAASAANEPRAVADAAKADVAKVRFVIIIMGVPPGQMRQP
jgi:hypothetical protein